ncbi:GlxA family transcriptional regulator [Hymenobacter arizonensis]|uniref:Transcriptional regulator GlxA family, contains an amidase domain and an AraC-type DNA-binding HTH domain n=1 Tax=Hymenobacter arizonensis TaxID=1227077 RepID=A0A1I5ZT38_HYMAR|nr:helix-turn-helix domain-containing protein [Hymenobacter arizonensis]SFQ59618.1 Transcriptional regulator GlxA family, contains an amidase domain and an AraC-type DNA-binding HTH domain [Hymenobacter arizonensis]
MKHISILVPASDAVVGSIEGPHKVFTQVNALLRSMGREPAFHIELVGLTEYKTFNNGLFTLHADRTTQEDFRTDLIIIPAPHGDMREAIALNSELIAWVKRQHQQGAEVASLCMGAFLLAATGLLDGRKCATHWIAAHDFRLMYPNVTLVDERVITDEGGLYSSGGAYSYLNLVLYLIEKYVGRELAVCIAKVFQIDMARGSQSPFVIFRGLKEHEDEPIKKAQEFIEANFQNKISVDELAAMAFLSRRNFERRFKKSTFNTVAEYIQRVKIEAAKMSLESSRENVNEVMYSVGYSDTKAFRALFKKLTGVSPVAYREKYSRKEAA